jgi:hypothetical protein
MTLGLFDLAFLGRLAAVSTYDTDAQAYITLVEAADGQPLETGVRDAINAFVVNCKADGFWPAIKASCILSGARTLSGALVPLTGAAPTNLNFVSGDYDRKTGLVGNGSTKYLNSNRNNNADPQNNNHNAVYASAIPTLGVTLMGAGVIDAGTNSLLTGATRSRNGSAQNYAATLASGFAGHTRSSSSSYVNRANGADTTITQTSQSTFVGDLFIFARNVNGNPQLFANPRLAFYSIGESLNLALLDAHVTTLINAFAAAIP